MCALHCGCPAMAYRHAAELMRELRDQNKEHAPEFEAVLVHAAQALRQLRSAEALMGLYAWAKAVTGVRHTWIKAAAEAAVSHHEGAVTSYHVVLRGFLATDALLEDLSPDSPTHSLSSSPKMRPDSVPRLSIMSKNPPTSTSSGSANNAPDPALANHMVQQVRASDKGALSLHVGMGFLR